MVVHAETFHVTLQPKDSRDQALSGKSLPLPSSFRSSGIFPNPDEAVRGEGTYADDEGTIPHKAGTYRHLCHAPAMVSFLSEYRGVFVPMLL